MARVWAQSTRKDGELLVMLALADFANDAGESWPSIPILAAKARLTERQVRRVLTRLEEAEEIRRVRSNGGRNQRSHYFITVAENPDKFTLKELQGKNNTVISDHKTLTPMSGATNRHRIVNSASRKEQRDPSDRNPNVKVFIDHYCEEYLERFKEKYVVTGKDGALVRRLLQTYPLDRLKSLALQFLNSADPWVRHHGGYTIGVFASQINKLVSTTATEPRPRPVLEAIS